MLFWRKRKKIQFTFTEFPPLNKTGGVRSVALTKCGLCFLIPESDFSLLSRMNEAMEKGSKRISVFATSKLGVLRNASIDIDNISIVIQLSPDEAIEIGDLEARFIERRDKKAFFSLMQVVHAMADRGGMIVFKEDKKAKPSRGTELSSELERRGLSSRQIAKRFNMPNLVLMRTDSDSDFELKYSDIPDLAETEKGKEVLGSMFGSIMDTVDDDLEDMRDVYMRGDWSKIKKDINEAENEDTGE